MNKLIGIFSLIWILSVPFVSAARSVRETTYRYDQIWSTAIRFLRVDSGFSVIEQDKGTGYVLFEYRDMSRTLNGAMELIPQEREGLEVFVVGIRIQDMPTYVENVLMEKLVRKLRDEYGEPPAARRVPDAVLPPGTQKRTASTKESKENADDEIAKDNIDNDENQ